MTERELSDHLEIGRVLALYLRAMDTWDYGLLDRVFTPDAELRYETLDGVETTYREMLAMWSGFNRHFSFMQHQSSQVLIDVRGDEADSTSNLRAIHVQTLRSGGESRWVIYGAYRDHLVRTPDGWRIDSRHFEGYRTEGEIAPFDRVESYDAPPWLSGGAR